MNFSAFEVFQAPKVFKLAGVSRALCKRNESPVEWADWEWFYPCGG